MIGRLNGTILVKQPPALLVDVNGVGYELEAPMSTFYQLPNLGEKVVLHTHLVVREDAQLLYGFAREAERTLFRALLKVSGVGGKVALAILSGLSAEEFTAHVHHGDAAALTRIPGIGKKTAERLIIEMRDRLETPAVEPGNALGSFQHITSPSATEDALSALVALGYKPGEAAKMVKSAAHDGMGTEEIIKVALQSTNRK